MLEPLELGERLLALLDTSSTSSTYKPALLLALLDRAQEHRSDGRIPVAGLAERVIELYWPQTLAYPITEGPPGVLLQNQGRQASIVTAVVELRDRTSAPGRTLPESVRRGAHWSAAVREVELTLAEMPIPRLQVPGDPFLYRFSWGWDAAWSRTAYRSSSRTVDLLPGVVDAFASLGPLLRPFILQWWLQKAAQLNPLVQDAQSLLHFESFLFGRDRVALSRIAEGLLDLQVGSCFYCGTTLGREREVDHFVPWSTSGDDGIGNLVVSCARCNNDKRAMLAGPRHVEALLERNDGWAADLASLAREREWPRNDARTGANLVSSYLTGSAERLLWLRPCDAAAAVREPLRVHRPALVRLLGGHPPTSEPSSGHS